MVLIMTNHHAEVVFMQFTKTDTGYYDPRVDLSFSYMDVDPST